MIITTLLLVLFCTVFFQITDERRTTAAVYIGLVWAADIFFGDLPGETYFVVMMFFNLSILLCLQFLVKPTELGVRLAHVSLLSIITNAVGLALWWNYYPPTIYVNMFIVLYGVAIVSLLKQDDSDVRQLGNDEHGGLWSRMFGDHSSRRVLNGSDKG